MITVEDFHSARFDPRRALQELTQYGATSFPLLSERARLRLLDKARLCHFTPEEVVVPPYNVRQEVSSCSEFPDDSDLWRFRDMLQGFLLQHFSREALCSDLFQTPLFFNDLTIRKYEKRSCGITPHRDSAKLVNLIAIVNLEGEARFCVCDDREGTNTREIDHRSGMVLLLRAPGFLWTDFRPFHFVGEVTQERYTFALRQNIKRGG